MNSVFLSSLGLYFQCLQVFWSRVSLHKTWMLEFLLLLWPGSLSKTRLAHLDQEKSCGAAWTVGRWLRQRHVPLPMLASFGNQTTNILQERLQKRAELTSCLCKRTKGLPTDTASAIRFDRKSHDFCSITPRSYAKDLRIWRTPARGKRVRCTARSFHSALKISKILGSN